MENLYDVVIVGGGPAGLTAALYLARAKYRVIVIEKEHFGGQITITEEVVNYPGVERTSGKELTEHMRRQAEHFGAEFMLAEVESLSLKDDVKTVHTSRGQLKCFGILLATGAHPRSVGFTGEEEFKGRGVAYCATCDGEFFTDKEVFVVGGGFAAAEESVFLTKYARHVTILVREPDFTCAAATAEPAKNHEKITVLTNTEVEQVSGDSSLHSIRYRNTSTGEVTEYTAENNDNIGVFVFAGYAPATALIRDLAELNEQGYVITDRTMKTSIDGLYAAGDVCVKPLRQVVTAVGDGALAATELEKYAAAMQQKTGLQPEKPITAPKESETAGIKNASVPSESSLFTSDMLAQLDTVFSRMASPLILKLQLDDRPVSDELRSYMEELVKLTDKLTLVVEDGGEETPCVQICRADGSWTGLAFHGVPGGHEFTSFVLGLYNASGPGQQLDQDVKSDIAAITEKQDLKVLVSLSCTMCPELVTAAQKLATENSNITAQVYDLNHFPKIKEQYNVMSVPCLIVGDGEIVSFGKKNIRQLVDLLKK
ncbi:MAG: FAD-dependent oxidoreductase [Lachnospiraceae bacterium]|nr:FAD-dependent oxidoreductase [Lachnospiraceae bacterium]